MVETDLEPGAGVEEQQQHWQQCEGEEKEDGKTDIRQMLIAEVSHISLIEEVQLRKSGSSLVIQSYRQEKVHRNTENLDIGEKEESGKGIH